MTDGRGQTPLKMKIVDVDEEREPVLESDAVLDMAEPTQVFEMAFYAAEAVFPEPGEYRVQLYGAGELLRELRLHVVPQQPPAVPGPSPGN